MKYVVLAVVLLSCGLSGCQSTPTRVQPMLGVADPVLARGLDQPEASFDLTGYALTIASRVSQEPVDVAAMRQEVEAWKQQAPHAAGASLLEQTQAVIAYLHETRKIALLNDSAYCCTVVDALRGAGAPPVLFAVLVLECLPAQTQAKVVDIPGGVAIQLASGGKELFVAMAELFPVMTRLQVVERANASNQWLLEDSALSSGLFLRPLTRRELASRLLVETGSGLVAENRAGQGLNLVTLAVQKDRNFSHLIARGRAWQALDNYRAALDDFNESVNLYPRCPQTYYYRGLFYLQIDFEKAIEDLQNALSLTPNFARAHAALGEAMMQAGRYGEALSHGRKAVELAPKDPYGHRVCGELYLKIKRYPEAAEALQKAVQNGQHDVPLILLAVSAFRQADAPGKALEALNQGLKWHPDHERLLYERAGLFCFLKRWDDAIRDFKLLLDKVQEPGHLYHELGDACIAKNDLAEAARWFRTGSERYPLEYTYPYKEARCAALMGLFDDAEKYLLVARDRGFGDRQLVEDDDAFVRFRKEKSLDAIFGR